MEYLCFCLKQMLNSMKRVEVYGAMYDGNVHISYHAFGLGAGLRGKEASRGLKLTTLKF